MSYQKLNQVTRPFTFPIPRWYDVVQDIDTEENHFISVGMYSGYWQVLVEEEAHERLAFSTLDGKRRWKDMPMVELNTSPTFVAIIMKLKIEWYTLSKECGLKTFHKKCCWLCVTVWAHIREDRSLFQNSHGFP